ncbi:hypothetical protein GY45DRAFT_1318188 [Cubamyces sp. BRFM 1775]|nr:hypothetical protein GY45DRAFT_1318188 [Cubamyces sp. BRFM 1775]
MNEWSSVAGYHKSVHMAGRKVRWNRIARRRGDPHALIADASEYIEARHRPTSRPATLAGT